MLTSTYLLLILRTKTILFFIIKQVMGAVFGFVSFFFFVFFF